MAKAPRTPAKKTAGKATKATQKDRATPPVDTVNNTPPELSTGNTAPENTSPATTATPVTPGNTDSPVNTDHSGDEPPIHNNPETSAGIEPVVDPTLQKVSIPFTYVVSEKLSTGDSEQVPDDEPTHNSNPEPQFKTRNSMTGIFSLEEREYIEIHLDARKNAGLTNDINHFIRQCVNFCVNYEIGWTFGRANVPRKYFEK